MTWNTNAARGDLASLLDAIKPPYVALLQEASEEPLRAFADARGMRLVFGEVRDGDRRRGNAILSTLPLSGEQRIRLPQERQPRAAVAAWVEVGGERLFVVSVHLENRVSWWKGGLLSDTARGRQADALVRALPADAPGIAGGDFNTWLGVSEPAWRTLLRRFIDTPAERPEPTFRDRLSLDHLFFDLPSGWQVSRRVLPERYGSDHHPVMGVLRSSYVALQ